MITLKGDKKDTTVTGLRGGKGDVIRSEFFPEDAVCGKLKLCAILTLPSGSSIGEHTHGPDAELYYIVSGTLRVTDNGVTKDLNPGDAVFTCGGNAHCVENVSDKEAALLAVIMN